jgi:hypothetical protein
MPPPWDRCARVWFVLVLVCALRVCVTPVVWTGEGECGGQYSEYLVVLDKCAMPKVWKALK